MTQSFIHLHNHSEFSLLDGMSTPDEICRIAKEHGQSAISLTDHGTCGGFLRFKTAGKKYGIKPLYGCEMYFTEDIIEDKEDKRAERFHLIMLAKNEEGLRNLYRLQKESWTRGFYYKPRIDWSMLDGMGSGLVVTSSCMGGIIAKCIMNDEQSRAEQIVEKMMNTFEDFYVELQPWNPPNLNQSLIDISDAYEIPMIGTIDCHYPTEQHKELEEILLCINQWPSMKASETDHVKEIWKESRSKKSVIEKLDFLFPNRRLRFWNNDHWIMSGDEVKEHFIKAELYDPTLFENTLEIADKCNVDISVGQSLLPKFQKKLDSNEYLSDIAWFELEEKKLITQEYKDRLKEELDIIIRLNFSDYFLIVWDVVNWAKRNNIYVGAGRGSAAGSLLSYVLGITDIDPIEHDLVFYRFLNPDRIAMPDIDLDFEHRRRDEVKQYLRERWGQDNVAAIATYGEFKPRASVKDIARVLGCPITDANKVTQHFEVSIDEFLNKKETSEFRKKWPDVTELAQEIHGRIRLSGAGAAGMVISSTSLDEIAPVESRNDPHTEGRITTIAYDIEDCEKLGLIKLDILALNTLSLVHDCIDAIQERYNIDVSKSSISLDSKEVFELFSKAETVGVFQCDTGAYKRLLLDMGIDDFNDLAISNALIRPGAFDSIGKDYIKRKKGLESVNYPHPSVEQYLKDTKGLVVFQESLMQLVVNLGGFTWSEADTLRKIIGKKRDVSEFEPFYNKWIENAKQYISEKDANKLWKDFEKHANYSFNKSHSVAYSRLSYQCMWLRLHYPLEFMWALLRNEDNKESISTYLLECSRMGIEVLMPDINLSDEFFKLEEDSIRFGLKNIAHLGPSAVKDIMDKRPFKSMEEFTETRNKRAIKENTIEALAKVDAFASLGYHAPYDYRKYYYEVLNYPADMDIETEFDDKINDCHYMSEHEDELGIIKAIVKSTKRTPRYFRIEFQDNSGSYTVFASQKWEIKEGEFLVAMVGDKSIHNAIDVYSLDESHDNPFYKFLTQDPFQGLRDETYEYGAGDLDYQKSLVHIVKVSQITTKKGQLMAYVYVWDGHRFMKLVCFPSDYGKFVFKLQPWSNILLKKKLIKYNNPDSGYTIEDIIELDTFLSIKRKEKEKI